LRQARRLALRDQQLTQLSMTFGVEGLRQLGSRWCGFPNQNAGLQQRVVTQMRAEGYSAGTIKRAWGITKAAVGWAWRKGETRDLIDGRRLALMKPGALLISVARAPIVDRRSPEP